MPYESVLWSIDCITPSVKRYWWDVHQSKTCRGLRSHEEPSLNVSGCPGFSGWVPGWSTSTRSGHRQRQLHEPLEYLLPLPNYHWIDQLAEDAVTLTNAANRSLTQEGFVLPLPGRLEKFVSTPAARFAVDVKAMAAACSLRAGSAALEAGKVDLAKDLLRTILNYRPQSEYAGYSLQAQTLLYRLETNVVQVLP